MPDPKSRSSRWPTTRSRYRVRGDDMRSLRAHHVRIRLPELSVAKVAWRANAASLGAATVIATVAMLHQTRWGAMVACLSFLAFLGSALVYRIAQLPVRRLRP